MKALVEYRSIQIGWTKRNHAVYINSMYCDIPDIVPNYKEEVIWRWYDDEETDEYYYRKFNGSIQFHRW